MNVLLAGAELREAQVLKSKNEKFYLTLEYNGNLALYGRNSPNLLWCSHSNRSLSPHPLKLRLNYDGDLMLLDAKKQKIWSTNSGCNLSKSKEFQFEIENDGNLLIKDVSGLVIWKLK